MTYKLSDMADREARQFAMYTIEARAIPNMIDGLKPVQRFYLYSSIKNSPKDFRKVSAISGVISDYGYNHGEGSAAGAGQLMAAGWANNICLIEGRGSFGTRLVPTAGAPRYVYTRLHANFGKYVKDIGLSPKHGDPEHEPPAFYVPSIPLVLANGVKGIATGFATTILPRSESSLVAACHEYIETGDIKERLPVEFPEFKGKTLYDSSSNRFISTGILKRHSQTIWSVEEIPYGVNREEYINILDKLEENGTITSYEDMCSNKGFKFEIRFKNATAKNLTHKKALQYLKLQKIYSENMNVIDENGKLRHYSDERQLIKDFVDYRMQNILSSRLKAAQEDIKNRMEFTSYKHQFILKVLAFDITFRDMTKDQVSAQMVKSMGDGVIPYINRLLGINILSLTQEMVLELECEIQKLSLELKFWAGETVQSQFIADLTNLDK